MIPLGPACPANDDPGEQCAIDTITVRVTPDCLRLEICKRYGSQDAWLAILDALADRWGH